jgi:hypothetical protein
VGRVKEMFGTTLRPALLLLLVLTSVAHHMAAVDPARVHRLDVEHLRSHAHVACQCLSENTSLANISLVERT